MVDFGDIDIDTVIGYIRKELEAAQAAGRSWEYRCHAGMRDLPPVPGPDGVLYRRPEVTGGRDITIRIREKDSPKSVPMESGLDLGGDPLAAGEEITMARPAPSSIQPN